MTKVTIAFQGQQDPLVVSAETYEEALEAIGTEATFVVLLDAAASKEVFERFDRHDASSDEEWAREICAIFLREGIEAAEAYVAGTAAQSATDYYDNMMDGKPEMQRLAKAIAKGVRAAFPEEDVDEILDAAKDMLRERMSEALEAADKSKPFDGIASSTRVIVAYMPGQENEYPGVEDEAIQGAERSIHPEYVETGRLLGAYLSFVNVPKDELLAAWRDRDGSVDPLNPVRGPGETQYAWERKLERAGEWADFEWATDPSRPRLQTPEEILEVMENAGYCSVPVLAFRVPLKAFMNRDWDAPLELTPGPRGRVGDVGLHNFVHGAGHTRANMQPITLPPGRGGYISTENTGYGYASVYDMVKSYLDVAIADGPKVQAVPPEPSLAPRM